MEQLGKMIMFGAALVFLLGGLLYFSGRIPLIGRLPGDIYVKKENFSFYFPLATSVVLSVVLTLILWLVRWFQGR